MNDILRIAQEIESQNLHICHRCLGRLFGKLGHNLDNPTRGKAIRFLLHLNKLLENKHSKSNETMQFSEVRKLLDDFAFSEPIMITIKKLLVKPYNKLVVPDVKKSITYGTSEGNTEILDGKIRALIKPKSMEEFIKEISINEEVAEHNDCIICEGLFTELHKFSDLILDSVKSYELENFLIGCKLDIDLVTKEEELWSRLDLKYPEQMKSEFNRELGKIVGTQIEKDVNFDTPDITIIVDTRYDLIDLQIASLFIHGRYRKLVRDIPQTRWPCKRCWGKGCENCNGTGKIYPTSVEEIIAEKVMEETKGKAHLFHGMGREDIEVRMLGTGRPFILEITQPIHRGLDLNQLQMDINNYAKEKVEVSDLKFTNHRDVRTLKADKPSKTYIIKVNFEKKQNKGKLKDVISALCGTIIQQRTPVRVSHRRADLVRKRAVLDISLSKLYNNNKTAEIEITGESGLYIKELIHGDSGRTTPSLASELDMECNVKELDVISINDDQ